jgi:hypothetical protein
MKRVFAYLICAGVLALSGWADDGGRNNGNNNNGNNNNNNNNGNGNLQGQLIGSTPGQHVAGIPSGGAPWMVSNSEFNVNGNGQFQVEVQGLLIASGTAANTVGPVTMVAASLICGDVVASSTASALLSASGNANMQGVITAPSPCIAPAVIVQATQLTTGPVTSPLFIAVNALNAGNNNQNNNNNNGNGNDEGHGRH